MARLSLVQNRGKPMIGFGSRGIADVSNHVVLGDMEAAVEELRALQDAGWRFWRGENIDDDPVLAPLLNDPRVQQIRATILEEIEAQTPAVLATLAENGYEV